MMPGPGFLDVEAEPEVAGTALDKLPRSGLREAGTGRRESDLIAVYTDRFLSDPKLANQIVTGACLWPPEEGIEWTYNEAVDLVRDRVEIVALGLYPAGAFALELAIAARNALAKIANEEDERRSSEDRLCDDGPDVRLL